jgi:DegV family protein with EDD domain
MQIVTDSGTDSILAGGEGLGIRIVPLVVTLNNVAYREGLDIQTADFYDLLDRSRELPTTSQPSPGDFAEVYREIAKTDPDILSIHISSTLSGTVNSAVNGARMVPEANISVVDTRTLAAGAGWQVVAAARAVAAGWPREKILTLLEGIRIGSHSIYTLNELKYLIHGGRISHIKGLLASILDIKPIIGVHREKGNYEQMGQARSFNNALKGLVDIMAKRVGAGEKIVAQVAHAMNPEGVEKLKELVSGAFDCEWLPTGPMSLVLGAHTGRSMVGICYVPAGVMKAVP